MIFSDVGLSQCLERAEGLAGAAYVEARARLEPAAAPCWISEAGAYAMFDGPESPVTQTFGLGLFDPVTPSSLDRIEAFFFEKGAPANHEISPMADAALWKLIHDRGYRPIEFTSLLYRDLSHLAPDAPELSEVKVSTAGTEERELWAATAARGWSESLELAEILPRLMRTAASVRGATTFLARLNGTPIATAVLYIQNNVALLAGGATVPEARRQGAQRALLTARLRYALEADCRIAAMGAAPGDTSQRNAEREGFRIAYTRTKWSRPPL
ncbi:MAG TPA: GNAT family N-acetyltransferase [Bryobacteraceae bacterium]|nr:GNAT family N-acetyltransferase [Bryobacteraceae bacterium]